MSAAELMPTTLDGRIVVATDGSDESIAATRWAARLAGRLDERVAVLDVLQQPSAEMPPDDVARYQHDVHESLAGRLRTAGIDVDDIEAVVGDVADVLAAASQSADLLVLGSAERVGWGRHGHFSLVHSLAHRVDCPLVVIPAGRWVERQPLVVVGIDGSAASRATLDWTVAFAARADLRVLAAFVIDDIYTTFNSGGWWGGDEKRARAESDEESVEIVERFGADPAVSLEAIAAEREASLLVVGAKGRFSLGGALLGAIPDELLHHPTCPVAVVPHSLSAAMTP